MKIRLLIASLILVLIGHVLVFAQTGGALVTLNTSAASVNAGDMFTVTIQVENAVGVYGGSIRLTYDPLALEPVTTDAGVIVPGDFFGGQPGFTLKNTADAAAGSIDYATTLRQPAQPVTGSGVLGNVQFRALRDGAVEVAVAEASLLAPLFEQVNGLMIARSVNEVPVEVRGGLAGVNDAAAVPDTQPAPQAAQPDEVFQPWAAPNTPPVLIAQPAPGLSPVMLAGIAFFMAGLLLFTMGVGSYVRLHRQLHWQEQV